MTFSDQYLNDLSALEHAFLEIKALIGPVCPVADFLNILNQLDLAPTPWSSKTATPILNRLLAKGLLTPQLAIKPEIRFTLADKALAAPTKDKALKAIYATLRSKSGRYMNQREQEIFAQRWLPLAILQNDEQELLKLNKERSLYAYTHDPLPWREIFEHVTLTGEWFASRTSLIQLGILEARAEAALLLGQCPPDYAELITACRNDPVLLARHYAMVLAFYTWTGQVTKLTSLSISASADVSEDLPMIGRAVHALLSDERQQAVVLFSQALRLHRKVARTKKGFLPHPYDLLHICALIADDDPAHHATLARMLEPRNPLIGHQALKAIVLLAQNQEREAKHILQSCFDLVKSRGNPSPLSSVLLAAASAIIDIKIAQGHIDWLEHRFREFQKSLPFIAGILAEALEKISKSPAPFRGYLERPGNETAFRFINLIAAKDPWERALASLEALLVPTKPAKQVQEKAKRLIWRVENSGQNIEVVEQSMQARGWSAGRAVSLKRLAQDSAKLDFLDDHDRIAIATIRRSAGSWYGQEDYDLPPARTLPALIGHPRVYDLASGDQHVELVAGHVEIVMNSAKSGFHVTLSHQVPDGSVIIEKETSGRWRVIVFDAHTAKAAAILGESGLSLPVSAQKRLSEIARSNASTLPLRINTPDIEDSTTIDGDCAPILRLIPHGAGLRVTLTVRPLGPDGPHFLPGIGSSVVTSGATRSRRDLKTERKLANLLAQSCQSLGGEGPEWFFDDQLASLEFLDEVRNLPTPPAMEWPQGQTFKLRGAASFSKFKASIKGAEGWFTIGGTVHINEDLVLDLKDLLARLDHAEGRFLPLDDGGFIALEQYFRQQLERLKHFGNGLKVPVVAGAAIRDMMDEAATLKADPKWKEFTRRLDEAGTWQPQLHAGFEAELREYQFDGYRWMNRLARWGAGALLADDMGLGKTVQTIAVMLEKSAQGPCLVVAPTSVCGNWASELARFAPSLKVHRLNESGDRTETFETLGPGDILICSYGLLVREEANVLKTTWTMAVLDEAQSIKNTETQRAKIAQRLQAKFRLALTGTPVENDLEDLWSLFRFINPGLLGSLEQFNKRFVNPITRANDLTAKTALKALVRPFLLRRIKTNVLSELPARTEQTLWIEANEEERALYETLRRNALQTLTEGDDQRTRFHILAEITKLRQACCNPGMVRADANIPSAKLAGFLELVSELRQGRHRALVFSQFVGHLGKIRQALDEAKISYQYLDGSTPAQEREKRVAAFQAGSADLFLISLKAGGFGLNLTAADYVIHMDPWWNPAVEDQASDRAHRIGQQRPVTIYRLIMRDTIEEGIVNLHRQKRALADALLDGSDISGALSEEDLLRLIRNEA